jgi:hypothetical protein
LCSSATDGRLESEKPKKHTLELRETNGNGNGNEAGKRVGTCCAGRLRIQILRSHSALFGAIGCDAAATSAPIPLPAFLVTGPAGPALEL